MESVLFCSFELIMPLRKLTFGLRSRSSITQSQRCNCSNSDLHFTKERQMTCVVVEKIILNSVTWITHKITYKFC